MAVQLYVQQKQEILVGEGGLKEVEEHWLRSIASISGLEQMYFDIMCCVVLYIQTSKVRYM